MGMQQAIDRLINRLRELEDRVAELESAIESPSELSPAIGFETDSPEDFDEDEPEYT